ncbi:MAG: methyltransferase domain-containing protein [Firmicutes bacterium]|nr:methyltransferase domain-containing protein [Bacillota bacterium]
MRERLRAGEENASLSISQLKEPHFWENIYDKARKSALQTRRRREISLDFWNRLAVRFEILAGQEGTRRRVDKVLAWLEQHGVLHSEMEVLDIGAGTGVFTVPLARRTKRVLAIEPAPSMLAVLRKRVEAEKLTNILFLDKEWEKIEPVADGLTGRFGLVFASLTPGVQDVESLMKMVSCSSDWCFLCDYAGRRLSPAREELWRMIFSEEMPIPGNDIIFPLNYLYTSGFFPSFKVVVDDWDEKLPVEETVAGLQDFFQYYTEITPQIQKTIADYVEQRAVKGIFSEWYRLRLGMILWRVADKWQLPG